MKRQDGQLEISAGVIASIATALALIVSIVTSCSLGAYNYGQLNGKVVAQQEQINKLDNDMEWVKNHLMAIAEKLGAQPKKQ